MSYYKSVQLYDDSRIVMEMAESLVLSEMTSFDRKFLCGLLLQKRPDYVLEIGVAEGGTSSVICYCLTEIGAGKKVISVDLCEDMWTGERKETGYVAIKEKYKNKWSVEWELYTGKLITEHIDLLERGIDFVVLDTVHAMPGEVLDFLAVVPFLNDGAIVVLHDVGLNHLSGFESADNPLPDSYATKLLFDVVKAEKYYMADESRFEGLSNIGAFVYSSETKKKIMDVFSSLSITWRYCPDELTIGKYRSLYMQHYDKECLDTFDKYYKAQLRTVVERRIRLHYRGDIRTLTDRWRKAKSVFIYGCGTYGYLYYTYAMQRGLEVTAMIVSDGQIISDRTKERYTVPIIPLSKVNVMENGIWIVMGVEGQNYLECMSVLKDMSFNNVL